MISRREKNVKKESSCGNCLLIRGRVSLVRKKEISPDAIPYSFSWKENLFQRKKGFPMI